MKKPEPIEKIAFGPEISPGVRVAARRSSNGEVKHVAITPMRDGTPLVAGAEIAHVDEACEDGWHTLTSVYKSGPAQVATPAYREGYDRIFGKKQKVGLA